MEDESEKRADGAQDSENCICEDSDLPETCSSVPPAPASKSELRKRARAAKKANRIFKAIDIFFAHSQNACPYINDNNVDAIECMHDVAYDESRDICVADVYRVKSEQKQPAVMIIHGGGFSAGDKKYRKGQSRYFAINGFTVFCVNYGLAPKSVFPEPILHLVNALNFIYDNAERFNIDEKRIIIAGDSAGAYYASVLATINSNADYAAAYGCKIKFKILGALLNCGLYNMQTVLDSKYMLNIDDGVLVNLAGVTKRELDKFKYKDVCMPINYVTPDFPPSFLIFSPGDSFCRGQSDSFMARLNEMGVYNEHYEARHNTSIHCFSLNWRGEDAFAANELMMSFAKRLPADKIKF